MGYPQIAIIGHTGMVGGTMLRYYQSLGIDPLGYSLGTPKEVLDLINNVSGIIFLCVPTPTKKNGIQDRSILYDVCRKIREGKALVVRSTVLPGTTDKLQRKFPKHIFFHNPEFLSEATCDADFRNPDRQIVGYTEESYDFATRILDILPPAPYVRLLPAKASEMVKYVHNLWGTMQVTFANQIYDYCKKLGIDYDEDIKPTITASKYTGPVISRYYTDIFHKGFRGFSGKCFPKDLRAFEKFGKELGVDNSLFKSVQDYNRKLLELQGLEEES